MNKCNYLYCLVAAKICTVCLELYRARRFFFRHCRRCFVASIGDQIFTRVDSTRAYYVMWSPNPARRCIREVSIYLLWKSNCIYLSMFLFFNISRYLTAVTSLANLHTCSVLQRVPIKPLYKLFSSDKPLLIVPLWGGGDKKLIDKLFLSFGFRYGQHDMKKIWNWSLAIKT